jgi:hypothetical protein
MSELNLLVAWQRTICSEEGPREPLTRLVLLALSTYMSGGGIPPFPSGDARYPTIKKVAENTRLSELEVQRHIKKAVEQV